MLTPEQKKEALTLRSAGYTISTVSEKLGIGATALKKLFKDSSVKRGDVRTKAVEAARNKLLSDSDFTDDMKLEIKAALADDLSLVRKAREVAILLLDKLSDDTTMPIQIKSRSLAAIATTISLTQETLRKALNISAFENQVDVKELESFTIHIMSEQDEQDISKRANNHSGYDLDDDAGAEEIVEEMA